MNTFRPTLYMPLRIQHPEAIQAALFAAPTVRPVCTHPLREPQIRLSPPGMDLVCSTCGDRRGQ